MGPLLSLPTCRLTGLLLGGLAAAAALSGCGSRCIEEYKELRLEAPYNAYFQGRPAQASYYSTPAIPARSSTGLTDSYPGVGVNIGGGYDDQPEGYNCLSFRSQSRGLDYGASLYGYSLKFNVVQYPDGPRLFVKDFSRDNPGGTRFHYRFRTGEVSEIEFRDPSSGYVKSGLRPEVRELTALTVGGRTYAPVWRLTNPYLAGQGRATAATVLYFSPEFGLVRFEQRDGTVWDLTP
ncbi:hypothetical protein EJV47_02965 [Hymenobacter gummosus]|uniref:Lipoprotein n=1 Tax=Hymenobacter gummosus TaxID=1776032 RepID=A0A431UA23_9BACT|nr:hypothetical protein [Hymenobacter gummosus]RTQ53712.1 hypothetical protein EJV47_02965 [Hymenobacter gummosus]